MPKVRRSAEMGSGRPSCSVGGGRVRLQQSQCAPARRPSDSSLPRGPPDTGGGRDCDPNYSGCLDPTRSTTTVGRRRKRPALHRPVTVRGDDHYGLDTDGDGEGCEQSYLGRGGAEAVQARLGGDARRRRVGCKSRKRDVGLAPDLPLLFPAAGAHDHESDVARDVKPCLYVVQSVVAAHLCRPTSGCSAGRALSGPSAQVGMGEHAADVVEETTRRKSGKWPTAAWWPRPGGPAGKGGARLEVRERARLAAPAAGAQVVAGGVRHRCVG